LHTNFKHIVFASLFFSIGIQLSFGQISLKDKALVATKDTLSIQAIDSVKTDSILPPKEFLEAIIKRNAKDYISNDFTNHKATLYNEAEIYYQDIELKSGVIILDYKRNIAFAKGITDSLGNYTQRPNFKQGTQESDQDSLFYNFKNKKAIIYNTRTEQEGIIIYGEITKRENDSVLYINKAHFTTSTKKNPDYEIVTNNIKVVPGKKIVGGLSQLYLANVPTPAFLPFFYAPITKGRSSGFIIPTWGDNNNQGFFLQNGGYYFAINDYLDLSVLGDVYSNGSWGLHFDSNYTIRYKFSGNFSLRFENLINSQRGFSDYSKKNNFNVRWSHSQSTQSSPNSRFSASVNFGTSQYFRQSLNEFNISQQVTNTFRSSISYYKKFVGTPFNMSISLNHTQNTNTKQINMTLPSLQLSMDRVYPFAPKSGTKKNPIQNIGLSYNLDAKNSINIKEEFFLKPDMFKKAQSGAKHTASASTNIKAFKYITLSPSVNYNEVWYLKTIDQRYDNFTNTIIKDTINKFDAFREYSGSVSASTTLYGMYTFKKGRLQAIRHVIRPSVSYSYRPDFSFYYDDVQQSNDPNDLKEFSRFEGGIFSQPSRGISNSIGFSLNNTLEAKMIAKDSTDTKKDNKIKLLNNLNFSTNYNMALDSLKWSPVRMSAGTQFFDNKLSLNASATLDPYALSSNGNKINTYNINNGGSLFRLTNANLSASYSLSNETFSKKDANADTKKTSSKSDPNVDSLFGSELTTRNRDDNQQESNIKVAKLYGASIPWNLSIRYTTGYSNRHRENKISNNSLQFSGKVEFSPKWSLAISSGYDFKGKGITFTNLSFERDLDSWRMSFNWVPFGRSTTYYFYIGVKSSVFSDLKYDQRKVPDRRLF